MIKPLGMPIIAPRLPDRGPIDLDALPKAKVVALLKARFPALKLTEVRKAAAEVMNGRVNLGGVRGKVVSPVKPSQLEGDVLTLTGAFQYQGARFDFYADYRLGPKGQFTLVDSGAD